MSKKAMTVISVAAGVVGLAAVGGIVWYAAQNDSGHTGANPWLALVVFVPAALVGVLHLVARRHRRLPAWPGMAAMVIGCGGVGLLVYLDWSNTLLEYGVWLDRGMP